MYLLIVTSPCLLSFDEFFFSLTFLAASQPKLLIFPPLPLPNFLPDKWLSADFPYSSFPPKHPHTVHFCLFSVGILSLVQFTTARGAHIHIPIAVFCLDGSKRKKKFPLRLPSAPREFPISHCSKLASHGGASATLRTNQRRVRFPETPRPHLPCLPSSASPLPHPNPADQISFHSRSGDSFSGPGLF